MLAAVTASINSGWCSHARKFTIAAQGLQTQYLLRQTAQELLSQQETDLSTKLFSQSLQHSDRLLVRRYHWQAAETSHMTAAFALNVFQASS